LIPIGSGDDGGRAIPFDPEYGLIAILAVVLVQQLGAPIPAWPVLMLAGAHAAIDPLYGASSVALATLASIAGSLPWFWAGGRYGHRVLRLTCRVSLSPAACVRQTETLFERYGPRALLAAKFVPGLAHVAPPIAGAFRLRITSFLLYFAAGSALGALVPLLLGLAFHGQIDSLIEWLSAVAGRALAVAVILVALYAAYRWLVRRQYLRTLRAARIGVAELKEMIGRGEAPIVLDVRSRTHRKLDARMIPGALPADVEDLDAVLARIAAAPHVVVYCACPNDATAVKVAMLLRRRGIRHVRPLAGGFDAWVSAGLLTTDR
jgi:membrane protein DedA with SNARE-associated domain/rhodanese-related sulfurtransferase